MLRAMENANGIGQTKSREEMIEKLKQNNLAWKLFRDWLFELPYTTPDLYDAFFVGPFDYQLGSLLRFLDDNEIYCSVYLNNEGQFVYRVFREDSDGLLDTADDRSVAYGESIIIGFELMESRLKEKNEVQD